METRQYLVLILQGYLENPKLFKDYLIRNQKIFERDFFITKDEFYNRCNEIVFSFNKKLEDSLYKRQMELYDIMDIRENKNSNIDEFKAELKAISKENFSVNLPSITNGFFLGNLWLHQILEISNTIDEICTDLSPTEKTEPIKKDLTTEKWFKTGIALATGEAFEIYRKLGANNPTEICRKINVPTSNKTYVSATLTDKDDSKNLFKYTHKLKALHKKLTEEKLDFGPEFLAKYNQIEPD